MEHGQKAEKEALEELLRRVNSEQVPSRGKLELPEITESSAESTPRSAGNRQADDQRAGGRQADGRRAAILSNLRLRVKVEMGRARLPLKEVLDLRSGGVVEFGKEVGEPVELVVNDTPIARGEVTVVDDRFCVRITELLTDSSGNEACT